MPATRCPMPDWAVQALAGTWASPTVNRAGLLAVARGQAGRSKQALRPKLCPDTRPFWAQEGPGAHSSSPSLTPGECPAAEGTQPAKPSTQEGTCLPATGLNPDRSAPDLTYPSCSQRNMHKTRIQDETCPSEQASRGRRCCDHRRPCGRGLAVENVTPSPVCSPVRIKDRAEQQA